MLRQQVFKLNFTTYSVFFLFKAISNSGGDPGGVFPPRSNEMSSPEDLRFWVPIVRKCNFLPELYVHRGATDTFPSRWKVLRFNNALRNASFRIVLPKTSKKLIFLLICDYYFAFISWKRFWTTVCQKRVRNISIISWFKNFFLSFYAAGENEYKLSLRIYLTFQEY